MRIVNTNSIRGFKIVSKRRPSVLVVSAPKSGTVYLNRTLERSLGLKNMRLCHGYFPHDHVSVEQLHDFVTKGGYIAATHIDPSPANWHLLDALLPRWIVHVRDPRASLLSWVHHVRRLHREGRQLDLMRVCPTPPVSVLAGNLGHCIDWHIDRFYRSLVAWIGSWVDVAAAWPHRVLLTEFAALHDNEQALCQDMAAFVGHAPSRYRHRATPRTMATHFRVGALDEWQHVFTPEQCRRTTAMLPLELCQRFGWLHDLRDAAEYAREWRVMAGFESAAQGD